MTAGRWRVARAWSRAVVRSLARIAPLRLRYGPSPLMNLAVLARAAAHELARRMEPPGQMMMQMFRAAAAMCAAQRLDLKAAEEGKITWAQYFVLWGGPGH